MNNKINNPIQDILTNSGIRLFEIDTEITIRTKVLNPELLFFTTLYQRLNILLNY